MIDSIKSEFRKLLSVRSTYIIFGLATLMIFFFAFYVEGYRVSLEQLSNPGLLMRESKDAILTIGLLGSIVGLLLVTHEYRYNTIMYTLTASNSRTKTLLAKAFVVSAFAVALAAFTCAFSPLMTLLGIHAKGLPLTPQHYDFVPTVARVLFAGWGYSMMAFVIAVILRSQVGAVSTLFLFPAIGEQLLGLLLKKDAVYLPFSSLQATVEKSTVGVISTSHAVLTFLIYFAVGAIVAWQLFLRRDAV